MAAKPKSLLRFLHPQLFHLALINTEHYFPRKLLHAQDGKFRSVSVHRAALQPLPEPHQPGPQKKSRQYAALPVFFTLSVKLHLILMNTIFPGLADVSFSKPLKRLRKQTVHLSCPGAVGTDAEGTVYHLCRPVLIHIKEPDALRRQLHLISCQIRKRHTL